MEEQQTVLSKRYHHSRALKVDPTGLYARSSSLWSHTIRLDYDERLIPNVEVLLERPRKNDVLEGNCRKGFQVESLLSENLVFIREGKFN